MSKSYFSGLKNVKIHPLKKKLMLFVMTIRRVIFIFQACQHRHHVIMCSKEEM
jgi:hypothetical protein